MKTYLTTQLEANRRTAEALLATAPILEACADLLIRTLQAGGTILVCGNGGSAADAQHIAAELVGRYLRNRPALPCVALTTDTSILTAVGNDFGYEQVFSRQVEALGRAGDLLWAFSTSGNSPNVIKAIESAHAKGMTVLGFTGPRGGRMASLCDLCFQAPGESTPLVQQAHQVAYHLLCDLIERTLFPDEKT